VLSKREQLSGTKQVLVGVQTMTLMIGMIGFTSDTVQHGV